jgi:hypothetical protein
VGDDLVLETVNEGDPDALTSNSQVVQNTNHQHIGIVEILVSAT